MLASDVKRRDTNQYQLASAGNRVVTLWALDPMTGSIAERKVCMCWAVARFRCSVNRERGFVAMLSR